MLFAVIAASWHWQNSRLRHQRQEAREYLVSRAFAATQDLGEIIKAIWSLGLPNRRLWLLVGVVFGVILCGSISWQAYAQRRGQRRIETRIVSPAGFEALGDLDPTFDTDGFNTVLFGSASQTDRAHGVAVQNQGANAGKIVVAGDMQSPADISVARFNTNGTLDTANFGSSGKLLVDFGNAGESATTLSDSHVVAVGPTSDAVEGDKIGVIGTAAEPDACGGGSGGDIAVTKLTPNGALDPLINPLGTPGKLIIDLTDGCRDLPRLMSAFPVAYWHTTDVD
jgi:hypothetical protein